MTGNLYGASEEYQELAIEFNHSAIRHGLDPIVSDQIEREIERAYQSGKLNQNQTFWDALEDEFNALCSRLALADPAVKMAEELHRQAFQLGKQEHDIIANTACPVK